ncbi:hypothetical protein CCP4SC76_2400001 [Gammaproteobacteria bacterium]
MEVFYQYGNVKSLYKGGNLLLGRKQIY